MSFNENVVEYKNEKFTRSSYNGISVIIDGDGYYNASKICKDNQTKFEHITRNDYWTSYIDELSGGPKNGPTVLIRDRLDLPNELKGHYIHRKLVNFLCFHVNLKYAIKVSEIMDLIDERNRLKNEDLEKTIRDMKNENDRLKKLAVPITRCLELYCVKEY